MSVDLAKEAALPGDDELLSAVLQFEGALCRLLETLDLTDDEVDALHAKWCAHPESGLQAAVAGMLESVMVYRQFSRLAAVMRPGETCVTIDELAARLTQPSGEPS